MVCQISRSQDSYKIIQIIIDERAKFDLGRQGKLNIVNESGLYNVILRSDKAREDNKFLSRATIDNIDEENVAKAAKYLDSIGAIKMSEGEPCNIKKVKDGVFKL